METKEQLVNAIRRWVKIDNEIRALQKEKSIREKEKKIISKDLIEVMKKNEIDEFDIKDGNISYVKQTKKVPITQKSLLSILNNYYGGDILKAGEMSRYILDNRAEKVVEKINRKIIKMKEIDGGEPDDAGSLFGG
jgi:hypothetical protein